MYVRTQTTNINIDIVIVYSNNGGPRVQGGAVGRLPSPLLDFANLKQVSSSRVKGILDHCVHAFAINNDGDDTLSFAPSHFISSGSANDGKSSVT